MKLYEAMACGVPVVASDVTGQGDFVRQERVGLVYDPHDPEELASAIRRLVSDPEQRSDYMNRAIKAAKRHGWTERAASIRDFLVDLQKPPLSPCKGKHE